MGTNLLGVMLLSGNDSHELCGGHIINISSYYVLPAKSDGTNPPDTDLYSVEVGFEWLYRRMGKGSKLSVLLLMVFAWER